MRLLFSNGHLMMKKTVASQSASGKSEVAQPRVKPAEMRLDELMDAAQKLFIAKGFDATTISDIVQDAQVAKGTFYLYFASKNEILTALRERFTQQFIQRIQVHIDACAPDDWVAL